MCSVCAPPQLHPAPARTGEQLEVATNQGHNVTTVSRYIPALGYGALDLSTHVLGLEWVMGRLIDWAALRHYAIQFA